MWKILTAASTAIALTAAPALADWEGWNADNDGFVTQNEFGTGFNEGGLFNTWDANRDAQLDENEWGTGLFGGFDRDDDQMWSEDEFGAYGERTFGGYGQWDEDRSGMLSQDEFNTGFVRGYDRDMDEQWNQEEYGAYEDDEWF